MTVEAVIQESQPTKSEALGNTLVGACVAPLGVQKALNTVATELTGLPLEHPTHSPLQFRDRAIHCLLLTLARPLETGTHFKRYIVDYI